MEPDEIAPEALEHALESPDVRAAYDAFLNELRKALKRPRRIALGHHGQHKHARQAEAAIATLLKRFFAAQASKAADEICEAYGKSLNAG